MLIISRKVIILPTHSLSLYYELDLDARYFDSDIWVELYLNARNVANSTHESPNVKICLRILCHETFWPTHVFFAGRIFH